MLNETNTKSLCIPYPVDGLDSEAGNDSADGIVLPLRAASMMGPATSQGSFLAPSNMNFKFDSNLPQVTAFLRGPPFSSNAPCHVIL